MISQVVMSQRNRIIFMHEAPLSQAWRLFVDYVSGLLGMETVDLRMPFGINASGAGVMKQKVEGGDLVMLQASRPTSLESLLSRTFTHKVVAEAKTSVLVARRPWQPFYRLLLVLRDEPADYPAILWALRLAVSSGAAVTILPLVPSMPGLYNRMGDSAQPDPIVLMASYTPMGGKVRRIVESFCAAGIAGEVHHRRGAPDWQIRQEAAAGGYDLLIIGAESHGRLYRWFAGELVPELLKWSERPVLIARNAKGA